MSCHNKPPPKEVACKLNKNPCKICLQKVTKRTGIRCQGNCQGWVHFCCLNYTPGKIKDVRAGAITVLCPCPDCRKVTPNEIQNKMPFTCQNLNCPANLPPKCERSECPANCVIGPPRLTPPMDPRYAQMANQRGNLDPITQPGVVLQQPGTPPVFQPLVRCGGNTCRKNTPPLTPFIQLPNQVQTRSSDSSCSVPKEEQCYASIARSESSMSNVQQMCNTLEEMATQLNRLMCTIKDAKTKR